MKSFRQYLEQGAISAQAAALFRRPESIVGTRFDPELAYLPASGVGCDGVGSARVFYSFESDGARRLVNWSQRPCRINTYGDSFTQCNQVSDGETWQEVLAAHFGEPLRNFGVGGYGVYQAYLRMKRMESAPSGAPYVILNIFEDDSYRSLMACRWLHLPWFQPAHRDNPGFHAMPWAHIRLDPATGKWVEVANPFNTPESLCQLADPGFVFETFRDDPILKLEFMRHGGQVEDTEDLCALARYFKVPLNELFTAYALASTVHIVAKAKEFLALQGKRLMVLLSYSAGNVVRHLSTGQRFDGRLLDELAKLNVPVCDILAKYTEDYAAFKLSPKEYCERQYIGHYNPAGNHFFAFAIKGDLISWLNPRPPACEASGSQRVLLDILAECS